MSAALARASVDTSATSDIPDAATLLRRPESDTPATPNLPALSLPDELEAWRDARARSRGEEATEPAALPRVVPEPVDETTLPSPLGPNQPPAAAAEDDTPPATDATSARTRSFGRLDEALSRPTGAPVEALAGSPVDFVLSDMGQWPMGGMDDGGAPGPVPAAVDSAATETAPSFVASAQRRAFWMSRPVRAGLWLGAVLLVLALVLQVALSRRSWLAAHAPGLAPMLGALCQTVGCTVAPYRDLDAIVIDSSAFNRSGPSTFRFTVTLRNQSDIPVATPALELTLTDALDQPVVRRVVAAAELHAPATLAARGEFAGASALVLSGVDNASAITGYRLMAFYP